MRYIKSLAVGLLATVAFAGVALAECERFYPVFDILSRGLPAQTDDLKLAQMQVVGES